MSLIVAALLAAKLPLLVRTYDAAGVPPRTFEHALVNAGATLAAAGIRPIWRPCHASGCIGKPKPHEIEIRIVRATARSERDVLGFAAVDVARGEGLMATVFADRVERLAAASGGDDAELLGRALVHEIGHLILGTTDHAPFGLMRATWTAAEIRRGLSLDWTFSSTQIAELRRRLSEADCQC